MSWQIGNWYIGDSMYGGEQLIVVPLAENKNGTFKTITYNTGNHKAVSYTWSARDVNTFRSISPDELANSSDKEFQKAYRKITDKGVKANPKRNGPLEMLAGGIASQLGSKVGDKISKWARGRKNPGSTADMSKTWHGRDAEDEHEIEETEYYEEELAELADVEELGVLGSNCKDEWTVTFKRDRPKLATDANGGNLEFIGGDQEVDGDYQGKQIVPLGWLVRIVYETDKHHLEGSNGYPESYEHYFGEEYYKEHLDPDEFKTPDDWWDELKENGCVKKAIGKKLIPMLGYSPNDRKLLVIGGVYQVLDVGIKN